jgi:hypothetical protein
MRGSIPRRSAKPPNLRVSSLGRTVALRQTSKSGVGVHNNQKKKSSRSKAGGSQRNPLFLFCSKDTPRDKV